MVISSKIEQKLTCPDKLCKTYDFTFVEKVQEFVKLLSKAIWTTSREHFYIGQATIIIPNNWQPPTGEMAEKLKYNGTISYVNFDEVPIRIYPDKVRIGETFKICICKRLTDRFLTVSYASAKLADFQTWR